MKLPYMLILTILLSSCRNNTEVKPKNDKISSLRDSEKSDIIITDSTNEPYIVILEEKRNVEKFELSKIEVEKINTIIVNAHDSLSNQWTKEYKGYYTVPNLNTYKRQYFPFKNNLGQKIVYINCFCRTRNDKWKTEQLIVDGGGSCYFGGEINLTTGKHSLMFNSPV
jgi:hypothetical protein